VSVPSVVTNKKTQEIIISKIYGRRHYTLGWIGLFATREYYKMVY